jgi:hypothetical protein
MTFQNWIGMPIRAIAVLVALPAILFITGFMLILWPEDSDNWRLLSVMWDFVLHGL